VDFWRAPGWLSVAVLIAGIGTPLHGLAMNSDAGSPVRTAELSGAGWTSMRFEGRLDTPEFNDDGLVNHVMSAQATPSLADLDALPPDQKPTGTKVPEPATLALLGVGLITASSAARIKRLPKDLFRTAFARFSSAQPHSIPGDVRSKLKCPLFVASEMSGFGS
jgi:hypothetical protein